MAAVPAGPQLPPPRPPEPRGLWGVWLPVLLVSCLALASLAGSALAFVLTLRPLLKQAERAAAAAEDAAVQMQAAAREMEEAAAVLSGDLPVSPWGALQGLGGGAAPWLQIGHPAPALLGGSAHPAPQRDVLVVAKWQAGGVAALGRLPRPPRLLILACICARDVPHPACRLSPTASSRQVTLLEIEKASKEFSDLGRQLNQWTRILSRSEPAHGSAGDGNGGGGSGGGGGGGGGVSGAGSGEAARSGLQRMVDDVSTFTNVGESAD